MAQNTKPKQRAKKEEPLSKVIFRNVVMAVSILVIAVVVIEIGLNIFTRHGMNKDVPNFIGQNLEQVEHTAHRKRLKIVVNDSLYVPMYAGGVVLEQRPSAGADKVKSGRKIYVTVNAKQQRKERVPYVAGFSLRQARSNLEKAGFEIERLEYVGDMAQNYVIEQRYGEVTMNEDDAIMAPLGSGVVLIVGRADVYTEIVPDLTGLSLRAAKSAIWDKGFNVGNVDFGRADNIGEQNAAKVVSQKPEPNYSASIGSRISLRLEADKEQ